MDSRSPLVSVSRIRSVSRLQPSSFPAQPGFVSASPFIPISAFLSSLSISGVLAAQPASSFLIASVYSTVVVLSNLPIPRLTSDLFCSSQLLPLFNLYKPHYGQIQVASFSCSVRRFLEPLSSVLRRHCIARYSVLRYSSYYAVLDMIDFLSLRGLSCSDHRFSSVPSSFVLCFMFYVLCFIAFTFRIGFLWCLSVLDYGFGMFVFGIASMAAVYCHSSRPASILAALFLPHASSPSSSPPSSSLRRSPFVASLLSRLLVVFSFVTPVTSGSGSQPSLGLRPSTCGSSSVVLVV